MSFKAIGLDRGGNHKGGVAAERSGEAAIGDHLALALGAEQDLWPSRGGFAAHKRAFRSHSDLRQAELSRWGLEALDTGLMVGLDKLRTAREGVDDRQELGTVDVLRSAGTPP